MITCLRCKNIFLGFCFYNIQNTFHAVSFAVKMSVIEYHLYVFEHLHWIIGWLCIMNRRRVRKGPVVSLLLCRSYPKSGTNFVFPPHILAMALYTNKCCNFFLYPSSGFDLGFHISWQWPKSGVSPGHWSTLSGFSQYYSIGLSSGLHCLVDLFYSWNGIKLGFLWLSIISYQKYYCEFSLSWWIFQAYNGSINKFSSFISKTSLVLSEIWGSYGSNTKVAIFWEVR